MRRILLSALVLCFAASSAGAHAADKKKGTEGQDVNMSPVAVPVIYRGRVVNYIFVTLSLKLAASADPVKLRMKEPYFRDALVRLASRTPLNQVGDFSKINEPLLRADMLAQCAQIVSPGVVTGVVLVQQATQHDAWTLPKPDPAKPRG